MTLESRGDRKEGLEELHSLMRQTTFNKHPSRADFDAAAIYYKNAPDGVFMSNNVYTSLINAWVFCASIGDYDNRHHEKMIHGENATGHKGNPSLDGWCVFDTRKLLQALRLTLYKHRWFSRRNVFSQRVYWRCVEYN